MFKFLGLISLSVQSLSQTTQTTKGMVGASTSTSMVGGENDAHGCLIGAGYTWCDSHESCIRSWVTPCEDNFKDCNDCLSKQTNGMNIACPVECNMIEVDDPMIDTMIATPLNEPNKGLVGDPISTSTSYPKPIPYPLSTRPMYQIDPLPPTYTSLPERTVCPEVMCMMYCENGYLVSDNGCQMCSCQAPTLIRDRPEPLEPLDPPEQPEPPEPPESECPIPLSYCNNDYICPKVTEVTHCSRGGIPGYTTYKLSLLIKNPIVRTIYAIYGDSNNGVSRPMSIPPAYQSPLFNSNIGGPAPSLVSIDSSVNYDSWLTMNTINGDPYETLSSVGIDFNSWNELHGIYTTDGAIFTTSSPDLNMNGEYIVGQITISDDVVTDVIMNFQGKIVCPGCTSHDTWTETQVTFHLSKPEVVDQTTIPNNCISWYDGCNTCQVNNGIIGGCTRLMCFREGWRHCLSFDRGQMDGPSGH